ncbi:hypothetical protein AB0F72_17500 [Actinoplanes sp. NPDC023936]|uniref:hypothetical protein n=1 Tax=Actinoplanes sp. NPDC023936 TaxID=3154910 RepID=UPI003403A12C
MTYGQVIVGFGERQWTLTVGEIATIGRSQSSTIPLPADPHLSRRAGSLRVLDDCLLVRNESARKPLVLRPPSGEDRVVEPQAATTSLPFPRFEIVFAGVHGHAVSVHVDASRLTPDPLVPDPQTRAPATAADPVQLTAAQRRMLVALCAPLLRESGPRALPATYAEIEARLDLRPQYVRNLLKALRETLTGYGVTGLIPDDDGPRHDDFRWALARWAIRGGWVTAADLEDVT